MSDNRDRNLRAVLNRRTIEDLTIKMEMAKKIPIERQVEMFFEMCDWGFEMYLREERKRFPGKSDKDLLLEYYKKKNNRH